MKKKVLVISTSMRLNSNSDALAEEFIRGAVDAGNFNPNFSANNIFYYCCPVKLEKA